MGVIANITEKQIENQILTYLVNKKIMAWKNQSVGLFDPQKKVFRKSNNPHHIPGVSDILGCLPDGRMLAIEVKKPTISKKNLSIKHKTQCELEKLASDAQLEFIQKVLKNNGVAFIADSIDVLEERFIFFHVNI